MSLQSVIDLIKHSSSLLESDDYDSAIAILEAAEKMKKKIDKEFFLGCWDEAYGDFNKRAWRRIFALLETLPDGK